MRRHNAKTRDVANHVLLFGVNATGTYHVNRYAVYMGLVMVASMVESYRAARQLVIARTECAYEACVAGLDAGESAQDECSYITEV